MAADYGYIDTSKPDHDGMKTDAFVGPHRDSKKVFVVNQQHPHTGKFNEHKVLLGYKDRAHALRDYAHSFSDGLGHKRIQSVVEMGTHELKDWLKKDHTAPLKKAEGGPVDEPRPLTIRRVVTPRSLAAEMVPPEEQGAIDGQQAGSPSPEGFTEGLTAAAEGVAPLGRIVGQYASSRAQDPTQIPGDIATFGKTMYHAATEDPIGFVGGMIPGIGNVMAAGDVSKLKDAAAQAEAEGNTELADKLKALVTTAMAGVAMPMAGGAVAKGAVRAGERAALEGVGAAAGRVLQAGIKGERPAANIISASGAGERAAEVKAKADVAHGLFETATGREYGTAPTDIPLLGRGDVTFPPGVNPGNFADEVARKIQDVKEWNNKQRRFWYENSGEDINKAVGGDPELADRLTLAVAKTSQGTPVLDNASYSARAHHQIMAGDPVSTGKYPAAMSPAIQEAYMTPEAGAVGPKISGYQSGFRSAWMPDMLNAGANDIHNMRWLGWEGFNGTPTTGQHNYDRFMRSSVTDALNREGFDNGAWQPGQVQAVGWAKSRAAGGVPEAEAGYDLTNAFADRTGRLTYETAPGLTTDHLPEYHDAHIETKQAFHDAVNNVLQDEMGRDRIASHMGLLTLPTEHGVGVYMNNVSPGSAARVVTGGAPGGWQNGIDASTKELMQAAELTRGLLLRQDASAYHFPAFPKSGMTWNDRDIFDVRTGTPMSLEEGKIINQKIADQTGSDFFSPIFTNQGYRFINVPEYSGISNKAFKDHLDAVLKDVYADHPGEITVGMGKNDGFYQPNDWKNNGPEDYLQGLRTLRPDIQRRAAELLATLGPRVSKVEDAFAKQHGWTPDKATRVWETNPAYAKHAEKFKDIEPGTPPRPQDPEFGRQFFDPELLNKAKGGRVGYANGGTVVQPDISQKMLEKIAAVAHDLAAISHKNKMDQRQLAYLLKAASGMYMPADRAMQFAGQIMAGDANGLLQRFKTYRPSVRTFARLNEMMGGKVKFMGSGHIGRQMQRMKGQRNLQQVDASITDALDSDIVKSKPIMMKALKKLKKGI